MENQPPTLQPVDYVRRAQAVVTSVLTPTTVTSQETTLKPVANQRAFGQPIDPNQRQ